MIRPIFRLLPLVMTLPLWAHAAQPAPAADPGKSGFISPFSVPSNYRAMLDKYCVSCHNENDNIPSGRPLYLDEASYDDVSKDDAIWEAVIHKVAIGEMPPQGKPHPGAVDLQGFRAWLESALDRAADASDQPGVYPIHRLNREEYRHSVREIFGVDIDVARYLPTDTADYGFDNIASALQTSSGLIGAYITAARQVATDVVGDREAQPTSFRVDLPLDLDQRGYVAGLPLGTRAGTKVDYYFPVDGEYDLSASLFRPVDSEDRGVEGQAYPNEFEIAIDGAPVHTTVIGDLADHHAAITNLTLAREAVAERMRKRQFVKAGVHEVVFTFRDQPSLSQDTWELPTRASLDIHDGADRPTLSSATIAGPFEAKGVSSNAIRDHLVSCRPGEDEKSQTACARKIFVAVATRAYRRPATSEDVTTLMTFYEGQRKKGDGFDAGIRNTLPVILTSPNFLFRIERDPASLPAGVGHPVTDLELASRLSFFLWSSIPDDELRELAVANKLHEPKVLEAQVKRMVADPRSAALTTNFPDQWLQLRNLAKTEPDVIAFQDWSGTLRDDLQKETELFFDYIVRNNQSALDLMNADYTFLNERLARHYGVPGIYGDAFRKVAVTDASRRGLLGQGSVLAVTSTATRTSPVFRGKWVMNALLLDPPLPPPPDVPALDTSGTATQTMRQRLDMHVKNEPCAGCHTLMDPIGFALERFGPTGSSRSIDAGVPIDASGMLMDGTQIDGVTALSNWLTGAHADVFVGTLTHEMLTYALGRGLGPQDMPVVRHIVARSAKDHYRFQDIILGIVESRPFLERQRPAEKPAPAQTTARVQE